MILLKNFAPNRFIVSFYIIGLIGILLPFSRELFLELSFIALIISNIILFSYDKNGKKGVLFFVLIYLGAFFLELVGVKTGIIFGHYSYGENLGPKIFDTPIIIGANWLMLSYTTMSLTESIGAGKYLKVSLAALLMVLYDIVLERVAPVADYWSWTGDDIPVKNYIAWFLSAVAINYLFVLFNIKTKNKTAVTILICQFIFLLLIFLFVS